MTKNMKQGDCRQCGGSIIKCFFKEFCSLACCRTFLDEAEIADFKEQIKVLNKKIKNRKTYCDYQRKYHAQRKKGVHGDEC